MDAKPKPQTLVDIFYAIVERNQPAVVMFESGGQWHTISSHDLYRRVMGVAAELLRRGITHGDRVAILAENRVEWIIADMAILVSGAATVPIYATLTAEQITYLLHHSGTKTVFVSTAAQLLKLRSIQQETMVESVILMDTPAEGSDVASMAAFMAEGPTEPSAELDAIARAVRPGDLATLIYTSGTTGVPKGAMLTHGNIASNIGVSLEEFDFMQGQDLAISFLPLSHITARHVDYAELFRGVTIAYCPYLEDMPRMMKELRPTIFVAVPRVYEKIYNQVQRGVAKGIKKQIYRWAMSVGWAHRKLIEDGKRPRQLVWKLANKLFFTKVAQAMGGRVRIFISGGAPLGRELAEWYCYIGLFIHEGYGLTETSPVIAVNTPKARRLGTVGRPLHNIEAHIAGDGELLVRGPSVFKGYWNMPDETAAAFEDDWFKTGDIGRIDEDGFLAITDRKKDLIKTSGGKFIAPQPIENTLKSNPLVAEAAILGDRRRFPSVVIIPAFTLLEDWARDQGILYNSRVELVANPKVQALYEIIVDQVNEGLARFERLKKVLLLAEELSVENGTLTPTMKLRRRNVEQRYKEQIERLYAESDAEHEHTATR
ncbi:MAG: long-chain fatty acid--CoA ligase [Acidobacteriota bacterium]|nr:long-chain fatty acid--CoA ligase [Acidobacteriota bacterium]